MDCIYLPNLTENDDELILEKNDIKHLKALQIQKSELLVTNGNGLSAIVTAERTGKYSYSLSNFKYIHEFNEFGPKITLAIGVLDSQKRMEFAVEKAVELGVNEIVPFESSFTVAKKIKMDRLYSKAIAALIQCKRSRLPVIHKIMPFSEILNKADTFDKAILCDENGAVPTKLESDGKYLLVIGPEGGLSTDEINKLLDCDNVIQWKMGSTRLRAETAAISAMSLITSLSD